MIVANSTSRPAPVSKSVHASDLCVSVFGSPNLSPINFELHALSAVEGSTFHCFFSKSRRIRTYAKFTRNPFTMNTSKTKDLKSRRIRTYKKTGEGGPSLPLRRLFPQASTGRFLIHSSPAHPSPRGEEQPCAHAGMPATFFPSCVYLITCGHPGGRGTEAGPTGPALLRQPSRRSLSPRLHRYLFTSLLLAPRRFSHR
jgi:hypothetical protein